ncbi:MAG: pitrilysin family protein, partial [Bacilli bacterium]
GVIVRQKTTEQSHICIGMPGLAINDLLMYPLILFNNLLGGSMSSRLFQEIREARGLAYSVFSYHTSYRETGHFTIYAGTAPKQVDEVIDITLNLLSDLKQNGISGQELIKSKEQLKGSLMLSLESTNSRMSRIGKNELLLRKHLSLDEIIALIDNVTLDHVKQVIDYVLSKPFSFAMVGPSDQLPLSFKQDTFTRKVTEG